jgi:hypothetical protein
MVVWVPVALLIVLSVSDPEHIGWLISGSGLLAAVLYVAAHISSRRSLLAKDQADLLGSGEDTKLTE